MSAVPRWHRAVADAAQEHDPASFEEAVRDELVRLWSDLGTEVRMAYRGCWSVGCDNTAVRIIVLSRLAGATSWRSISFPLLLDGTYQGLMTDAGIPHDDPGEDDLRKMQELTDSWRLAARSTP
jgi:hypothetical protein